MKLLYSNQSKTLLSQFGDKNHELRSIMKLIYSKNQSKTLLSQFDDKNHEEGVLLQAGQLRCT